MYEFIDKAARLLADTKTAWVMRRDAADMLGQTAAHALAALNAQKNDSDVDVRTAVQKALGQAAAGLAGIKPEVPSAASRAGRSLEELAQSCAKNGVRTVSPTDTGFQVEVILKNNRKQAVYITPFERKDGGKLVRIFSTCGKPTDDLLKWALQTNSRLTQSAFAIAEENGEEHLILVNCFIATEATPLEVKAAVKEIAFYSDWLEQKLGSEDVL